MLSQIRVFKIGYLAGQNLSAEMTGAGYSFIKAIMTFCHFVIVQYCLLFSDCNTLQQPHKNSEAFSTAAYCSIDLLPNLST